jgi:preprotein translocase subunit SecE
VGAFFSELLHVGIYKRSQGRITRQVTFASVMAALALGLMRLSTVLAGKGLEYQFAVPGLLLLACVWATYRLVNVPAVADFLIAVEAEMNKVSWPTRSELIRASMVVLLMMFALAFYLGGCDVLWSVILKWGLGI